LNDAERAAEAKALEHSVKSYIGVTTKVKVVEPGKVERSQGKAKRVIDLRPKG
jgi:phenylacetate-CoA ligase